MCAARLSVFQQAVREAVAEAEAEKEGRGVPGAGLGEEGKDAANVGGRPRVLDETKQAEICALLAAGCSLRSTARYVGCNVSTISRLKNEDAAFRARVMKALAEREVFALSKLRAAADRSWRAAALYLERTVGGHYRRDSTADPVDWEEAITAEALEQAPEIALRVMQKFRPESEEEFRARMLKQLEPRDEVEEVMRRVRE